MLAGRSAKARNEDDRCRRPFHAGAGFTRGEIAQTSAIPPGEVQGPLCSLCWEKTKVLTRWERGHQAAAWLLVCAAASAP